MIVLEILGQDVPQLLFGEEDQDGVGREQDGRCLQEFWRQAFGLRGQPGPLCVIQQDVFVLLLLFLQDPDLLLEVLELETPILVLLTAWRRSTCYDVQ